MKDPHTIERSYAGLPLPSRAKPATEDEIVVAKSLIANMYQEVKAPSKDFPHAEILMPRENQHWRVVRGTLELLDDDDGFEDENIVDRLFCDLGKKNFYFWNGFGMTDLSIIFTGHYSRENRQWMMNARFKDNLGITSEDGDLSIVSDIFFGFNIISGTQEKIASLDEMWGGKQKLVDDFALYLDKMIQNRKKLRWVKTNIMNLIKSRRY